MKAIHGGNVKNVIALAVLGIDISAVSFQHLNDVKLKVECGYMKRCPAKVISGLDV